MKADKETTYLKTEVDNKLTLETPSPNEIILVFEVEKFVFISHLKSLVFTGVYPKSNSKPLLSKDPIFPFKFCNPETVEVVLFDIKSSISIIIYYFLICIYS